MSAAELMALTLDPSWKWFKRMILTARIKGWERDIEGIRRQRENDIGAEVILRNDIVAAQIALIDLK